MDRAKVKVILDEARKALEAIAGKYGLTLKPVHGRFDSSSVRARLEFVEVQAAAAESKKNADFCAYSFSIGDALKIRSREYKVTEIKPSGVVLVSRIPDGKGFRLPVVLAQRLSAERVPQAKRPESEILSEIRQVYNRLSPENLSCDGELSPSQVHFRYNDLRRKLTALQVELGRNVSEEQAFAGVR